ncbi:MAG: hypothetical protein FWH40_07650 [Coriobacteriia bacterium]|nr:hypothetical protein [Coriobacteriia bacterium]
MPTLTPYENYMRMMRGEMPEYVPAMMDGGGTMGMVWEYNKDWRPAMGTTTPGEIWYDMFGVPYVSEWNANNGSLPAPGQFILEDITKWRDVIKKPAILENIDWEYCASVDLPKLDPQYLVSAGPSIGNGYFQMLVAFMGFDNGLIACYEEPEEVKDLLTFLKDLNVEMAKEYIHYYKPGMYGMGDDIAHDRAPFVSLDIFLDIFEPMWRATVAPYKEAGCLASHHNCGKLDEFIPYIVDMGFDAWNPAEPSNDLVAIKEKFLGRLAICGGFANNGPVCYPETTEEEVRGFVKEALDLYSPGGSYAFGGFIMGPPNDPVTAVRQSWINDEFEKIRYSYY